MAENDKKYIDLTGLTNYDAKIKALINSKDADAIKAAKDYADSLAKNYDAAGAATTALSDAKAYTDGKIDAANTAIADAKKAGTDAGTAAANAQTAADKAQGDVDALKTLVGTIPEGSDAKDVIAYVDKKTSGIASDEALTALAGRVTTAEGDIDAIQADYLKAADKTELQGDIDSVTTKVTTLVGEDANKSVRTIANEELVKQLIAEGADEKLDTLKEIADWIQQHPKDAAAMNTAISNLETLVGTIPEADKEDAATIVAYIQKLVNDEETRATAAEGGLDTRLKAVEAKFTGDESVAKQIETAVNTEKTAREAADTALDGKITTAQKAAEAAQGDVDALETVVAGKADQTALDTVSGKVTTAEGKIATLEGKAHTHTNADVLNDIDAAKVAAWDGAVAKQHEHSNKTVLDGITSAKVSNWDAAEQNAKAYTDTKIGEFVAVTPAEIEALFATE